MSWNVNGVRTKLEKVYVYNLLLNYDVICLYEIKTPLSVSFPGYVSYISRDANNPHRGGTCVLIKQHLNCYVAELDVTCTDQVWFKLKCIPDVLFGFCYVPPPDSPYFSLTLLSNIQEKIKSSPPSNGCVVMGDMNARFGSAVLELPGRLGCEQYSYTDIPDRVQPNDNANALLGVCIDEKLIIVNNLCTGEKTYSSNRTYRQGRVWVSELDSCIMSTEIVKYLCNFSVNQDLALPSDHAPVSIVINAPATNLHSLYTRASRLGDHAVLYCKQMSNLIKNPLRFSNIDPERFVYTMSQHVQPVFEGNIDAGVNDISRVLYECARVSKIRNRTTNTDVPVDRWEGLLEENDEAQLWRAINWRGELNPSSSIQNVASSPTEYEFKEHFERMYNPSAVIVPNIDELQSDVYMPVLDDPILPQEVQDQVKRLKCGKACGPDGVPPGIFKLLPPAWILTITTLFNSVFTSATYPSSWVTAKLFTVFKRGSRALVSNYRGISVINSFAKLYDMVLCARLNRWFSPYREQAGCQAGRGCLEHIVTLRLLCDVARRKKFKLFITFVDFSQAYDRVPRDVMFRVLKRLGCGVTMLLALVALYKITHSVIGSAVISATVGVRQGSPTSCLLFIIFVNDLIRLIKQNCGVDGFLAWLHLLILMDDTVLLATNRENMIHKIRLLNQFCASHGMKINESKTNFFVINGNNSDKEAMFVDDVSVSVCDHYTYLGSPFSADGSITTSIKLHAQNKMCHALKFVSFINKNNDVPFHVKIKVFQAAFMSTILYGCESWLNGDIKPVNKLYMWCIKQMLGVRKTTCNDLCLMELGYPTLRSLILSKQRKFFSSMWRERKDMCDDPLSHAIKITLSNNTQTSRYVRDLINNNVHDVENAIENIKLKIISSESNRVKLYNTINPDFSVHPIYMSKIKVNERERISWTRFRVSAHSLAIEEGRWNRRGRGRLPVEERLCSCGHIQTEQHVVEDCARTQHIRQQYNISTMKNLLIERTDVATVCTIIHKILAEFS